MGGGVGVGGVDWAGRMWTQSLRVSLESISGPGIGSLLDGAPLALKGEPNRGDEGGINSRHFGVGIRFWKHTREISEIKLGGKMDGRWLWSRCNRMVNFMEG